jgi:hypothetical protein
MGPLSGIILCLNPTHQTANVYLQYPNNHWSDLTQILNLSLADLTKLSNTPNEDDLQWKMTSKYFLKNSICNISTTAGRILLKFEN